jgi:hypothetical protein
MNLGDITGMVYSLDRSDAKEYREMKFQVLKTRFIPPPVLVRLWLV